MMTYAKSIALTLAVALPACGGAPTTAPAPSAEALRAATPVDWAMYAQILSAVVDAEGRVDYASLREVREPLDGLVLAVATYGPAAAPDDFKDRDARLAYALNAYNLFVLRIIVDLWPLATLDGIQAQVYADTQFTLDGQVTNLETLEEQIRDTYHDVRVRFALANGALDGPPLSNEPYMAELIEMQLTRAATRFVTRPRTITVVDGRIQLNGLFGWYADELTPTPVEWIKRHAPGIILPKGAPYDYAPFDWSVNVKGPERAPIIPEAVWSVPASEPPTEPTIQPVPATAP